MLLIIVFSVLLSVLDAVLGVGVNFCSVSVTVVVARCVAFEGVLIPLGRRSLTILIDLKQGVVR